MSQSVSQAIYDQGNAAWERSRIGLRYGSVRARFGCSSWCALLLCCKTESALHPNYFMG